MVRNSLRGAFVVSSLLTSGIIPVAQLSGQEPKKPAAKPVAAVQAAPSAEEAIEHALQQPVTLEFVETPLTDVVEFLAKQTSIQIQLDKKALDEAGAAPDTPVSWNLQKVKLASALDLMLDELDLDYVVRNEVLQITTKEKADATLETKVYPVGDLVLPAGSQDGFEPDFVSLITTITTTLTPQGWEEVGGPGTIEAFPHNYTLVCSQSHRVHQQIERLLADLRSEGEPKRSVKEAKILRSLDDPSTVEFVETPLSDVVQYLRELHQIDIQFDKKAFDEAGAKPDTPVSWNLQGIKLRNVLKLILEELDLTYVVRDEVLLITTKETDSEPAVTYLKVYKVTAPTTAVSAANAESEKRLACPMSGDFEERLAKAIQESVAPDTWTGDGISIRAVPGALLVRQSAAVHSQIRKTLKELSAFWKSPISTTPNPVVGSIVPER